MTCEARVWWSCWQGLRLGTGKLMQYRAACQPQALLKEQPYLQTQRVKAEGQVPVARGVLAACVRRPQAVFRQLSDVAAPKSML